MGKLGNVLGMIGEGAGIAGTVAGILGIGEKRQDRRQIEQQKRLQELQIQGNKEMSEFEKNQQLDMWNKTNYGAQVNHLKEAGLNPALLYGMGGSGGATTGGGSGAGVSGGHAATGVQGQGMALETALATAQLANIQAQTEKTKAEAKGIEEQTTGTAFQNAVNKAIGAENLAAKESTAIESLKLHWSKQLAEYETWSTVNYEGKPTDDPYSPIAKAMRAGIEKTLVELQQAKTENNIAKATQTIKEFEAKLAEEGIAQNTPWYVKMVMDLMTKSGLNLKSFETGDRTPVKSMQDPNRNYYNKK